MVSGFLTSPLDHVRIESAVARPILSWSKLLTSSMGIPSAPLGLAAGVVLVAASFGAREVDAELLGGAEDVFVELTHLDLLTGGGEDLDVEAQGLHLLDEDLEALRDARLGDVLALDDGLVDLDPAEDVVGLDREDLLERVRRAVGLERPDLHLTEPLTAELRLPTQRLLRDHRVRTGRPGVDLVVHEVGELQDVDVADGHRPVVGLTRAAVVQRRLAVVGDQALAVGTVGMHPLEELLDRPLGTGLVDLVPVGAVEHRRVHPDRGLGDRPRLARVRRGDRLRLPAVTRRVPEVRLEDLADVHAARNAERVEHDVDGRTVREVRHVLDGEDLRDDALVAVASGELVALADLALLGHVDAHQLVHAGRELVALLTGEHADVDDLAGLAVRHLQRGVAHLTGLLTEDRAQEALLRGELGLALGRDLADEDVAGADLGTDADDAALVEVLEDVLGEVRDVAGDLLGAQLRVAGVDLVLLDVDRREHVVLHETLGDDDRVLVVVALPRHERHEEVLAERELALVGRRTVGDDLAFLHRVADVDPGLLVDAGALVRTAELGEAVRGAAALALVVDDHGVAGDVDDGAVALGEDDLARVTRRTTLDAGADERRGRPEERDGLALHVGAHERAVGVVVLEERDERGRHRHDLLRRHVHVVDLGRRHERELASTGAHEHAVVEEATLVVDVGVRLGDDVAVFVVGGEVLDLFERD